MSNTCTVPILATDLEGTCTLDYVVHKTEYAPAQARVKVLVNGQAAFGEVHKAIARAKKSVLIICWGFQPSMHFVRNGSDSVTYDGVVTVPAQIGKLLEHKAKQGVKVRVLCFGTPDTVWGANVLKDTLGEPNLPGAALGNSEPDYPTDHAYDKAWFKQYWTSDQNNLSFMTRDLSVSDRVMSAFKLSSATDSLDGETKTVLSVAPSHHQKTVLVDYDDPQNAVGFVMGHNTLSHYWDTDAHSHIQNAANVGRNGNVPFHDFSVRVTGPAISGIFQNFHKAWEKERAVVGATQANSLDAVVTPAQFEDYPLNYDGLTDAFNPPELEGIVQAQILRTQPQYNKRDIEALYLNALNNTTSLVYVENQYFRWPPFAEKLKTLAARYAKLGRPYPVYLFAVTNSSDAGMGSGTVNTYRMLETLGQANKSLSNVDLLTNFDQMEARLKKGLLVSEQELADYQILKKQVDYLNTETALKEQLEAAEAANKKATTVASNDKYKQLKQAYDEQVKNRKEYTREEAEPEGLKSLICTLVAPDTPAGVPWQEVYIHAKMMMVNDAFLTIGSTNLNTRSMQVDSEMNIAFNRPEITQALRKKLWKMHTNDEGPADFKTAERLNKAYDDWKELLERNANREAKKQSPECSLRPFKRDSPARTNSD
jgi:phosphatidylserine/phosphatidylglycerophosphate/cardiolipin synthase-like enzyme